jgi:sirohydrochlorin cobaltochelatase
MTSSTKRAVVLFAHGSRDPLWPAPIEAVARLIRQTQPDIAVHCAYLELSTPDLQSVSQTLADQGICEIVVLPMFLGIGKHAREDLPRLVAELQARFQQLRFDLRPAVGEDPRLTKTLAEIACSTPGK